MKTRVLLITFLLCATTVAAERTIKAKLTPVMQSINNYLDTLLPDQEWRVMISQLNGGTEGYCADTSTDVAFDIPCTSQLDCLCKEHDLGDRLRRYRDGDLKALDKVLGTQASKLTDTERLARVNRKIDLVKAEHEQFVEQAEYNASKTPKRFILSIQPLHLFSGIVAMGFEWKIEPWVSLRSGVSFLASGLITNTYLGYGNEGDFSLFINTGGKFYFVGESMSSGFYAEPRIEFGYENKFINPLNALSQPTRLRDIAIVPGLLMGFDKLFSFGLQIDLGVGVGYYWAPAAFGTIPQDYKTQFLVPKFQASVGYAW